MKTVIHNEIVAAYGSSQDANDAAIAAFRALAPSEQVSLFVSADAQASCTFAALTKGNIDECRNFALAFNAYYSTWDQDVMKLKVRAFCMGAASAITKAPLVLQPSINWRWSQAESQLDVVELTDAEKAKRADAKIKAASTNEAKKARAEQAEKALAAIESAGPQEPTSAEVLASAERAKELAEQARERLTHVAGQLDTTRTEAKQVAIARDAALARIVELEQALADKTRALEHVEGLYIVATDRANELATENATLKAVNAALIESAKRSSEPQPVPEAPKQGKQSNGANQH